MDRIKQSIGLSLYRVGLSANAATVIGLFFAALSGVLIVHGGFFRAGVFLLLAGLFDLLDGSIARASGKMNPFGAILDSSLDRYGDFCVLAGVILFCVPHRFDRQIILTLSVLMGSFEVSYVRARAECVIDRCRVGFWERGERLVYLSLGLLLNNLPLVLLVLAVGTHLTALARMSHAHGKTIGQSPTARPAGAMRRLFIHTGGRANGWYFAKIAGWFLLVSLVRIPFGPIG